MTTAMSTTNQIFDWSRFTAALRKEVVENQRQLLLIVASMFLFFTVVMIISNVISRGLMLASYYDYAISQGVHSAIISLFYSVIIAVTASLAFRNLTSKSGRVAMFTSPISTTEKFLVNLLIYVIGALVAFIVCVQLADLTRIAVLAPFTSENFHVPGPINYVSALFNSYGKIMHMTEMLNEHVPMHVSSLLKAMAIISTFLMPALYFMGSVLWPRMSLVKSFFASQIINIVVSIIMAMFFAMPLVLSKGDIQPDNLSFLINYTIVSSCINLVILACCWVGSWYLFKHKDVVSLKWWS